MSENTRTTLVLGASGRTGSLVVADLLADDREVMRQIVQINLRPSPPERSLHSFHLFPLIMVDLFYHGIQSP